MAAPLDALEGICRVTVFFTVDDLGSHIVETDVRELAGPCTLPGVSIQHTLSAPFQAAKDQPPETLSDI